MSATDGASTHPVPDDPGFASVPLPPPGASVAIGLSGGVDSAVAALRLLERGCEPVGLTTKNFCASDLPFVDADTSRSCCSDEAVEAARDLCAQLGIPHRVVDVAADFRRLVIDDFVDEYRNGRTPNPCVRCNRHVRFPGMLDFASKLDVDWVATGHYARLVSHDRTGLHVARGADEGKDQSYYLHRVDQDSLARLCFPLGDSHKGEVRDEAGARGLSCATAPESQEICFVPGGDRGPLVDGGHGAGDIVDRSGSILGRHRGLAHYTVGQRKGLGLPGGQTLFVSALDAPANRVIVGAEDELDRSHLICDQAWLRDPGTGSEGLVARTRSRHSGRRVDSARRIGDKLVVDLSEPDRAPAPGQSLVLYRDGVVVGGGRLEEAR